MELFQSNFPFIIWTAFAPLALLFMRIILAIMFIDSGRRHLQNPLGRADGLGLSVPLILTTGLVNLIGGLFIPVFGLMYIGDGNVMTGLSNLMEAAPEKFNSIGDSNATVPFATIFTGMMLVQLFYWGTNQAIIQRALAAKNLVEGQKGLLLAAFFKILGPLIVVLPGIIAFYIFKG